MAALCFPSPHVHRLCSALLACLWACAASVQATDDVTATALKNQGGSDAPPAPFSYEVFATPQFKSQFALIVAPLRQVAWLTRMEGPNSQIARVKVGSKEYVRADLCKPHDCHDYNVLFLYAPERNVLYAQVHQKGQVTLLGDPPRAEAAALGKLWTAQFRSP